MERLCPQSHSLVVVVVVVVVVGLSPAPHAQQGVECQGSGVGHEEEQVSPQWPQPAQELAQLVRKQVLVQGPLPALAHAASLAGRDGAGEAARHASVEHSHVPRLENWHVLARLERR